MVLSTLLHAAVHQIESASYLQQGTASGDFMGRTNELYLHIKASFLFYQYYNTGFSLSQVKPCLQPSDKLYKKSAFKMKADF